MATNARTGWAAIGLVLGLSPGAATAQDGAPTFTLDEIVIPQPRKTAEATQVVSVVTADEIRQKGAQTLDQALELLPGVNVRVGAEGLPRIDLRGFRTRHVLLLLDGIPLNSSFDGQFDPGLVPTEDIAEIRLTQGASSVVVGPGGLGGVIEIVTKKGSEGLHGGLGAQAGDHAPYLARASLSGARGPMRFFGSGSSSQVDAFPLPARFVPTPEQGGGYRANSDRRGHNAFGNLGLALGADLELKLTASYGRGSYGRPSSVIDDPLDPFATPPRYDRVDEYENFSVQSAVDWQPTRRFGARAWAFVNRLSEQETQYDDASYSTFDRVAGSFRERVRSTVQGASAQPRLDLDGAGVLTFLLSGERDGWDASGTTALEAGATLPVHEHQALDRYSTAVQYEFEPLARLGVVAGYGHHWQARDAGSEDGFSALAAGHLDLLPATRLKASYSHGIRFPTLRDLYRPAQGNPALVAERADTVEAGVEQRLDRGVASVTAWVTRARDLIQTDPASGRSTNLAEIRFAGLELAATVRLARALLLRGSFTYLDSQDRSREGRDEQQYTPREKVAAEATYEFDFGLSPYVAFLYLGDQYYYTKNAITPVAKGRLDDLFLVDVKLTQRIVAKRLSAHVGAKNLLDRSYETSYGFPQPGRYVYGGVELQF